jgi:hypothetical protein
MWALLGHCRVIFGSSLSLCFLSQYAAGSVLYMLILPIKEKAKVESQNSSALIKERIFVGFKHKSMQPAKNNQNSVILLETSTMFRRQLF